jgi:hypothetical protein
VSIGSDAKLHFPSLPTVPGVYRFRLLDVSEPIAAYIGETGNLHRRVANYRNPDPTQQTNIRIHGWIRSHLDRGGTVECAAVTRAALTVDENSVPLDRRQKLHRLLLENAALFCTPNGEFIENLL